MVIRVETVQPHDDGTARVTLALSDIGEAKELVKRHGTVEKLTVRPKSAPPNSVPEPRLIRVLGAGHSSVACVIPKRLAEIQGFQKGAYVEVALVDGGVVLRVVRPPPPESPLPAPVPEEAV